MSSTDLYPIAIPFKRFQELEGKVKEYNINYNSEQNELEKLIDFVTLPFIKRVNITFSDKILTKVVNTVNKIKDCVYVRVMPEQWSQIQTLQEEDVKFFFDATNAPSNICQLNEFIQMGVTDVYIADDLTYNLDEVSKYCHSKNINLRVILNIIPMSTYNKGNNPKDTFYRPMDIPLLEQYYDTFEFDCGKPYDWHKFNVLFKAYFVNQYWHGPLMELIPAINLENGFQDDSIMEDFTYFKVNCGRRCGIRTNSPCNKCQQFFDIGTSLVEKNVGFK